MEKLPFFFCCLLLAKSSIAFVIEGAKNSTEFEDGRIVGGEVIPLGYAPYQVSMQLYNIHICGGSIISQSFVMTAAHCATPTRAKYLSVRVGTTQVGIGGEVITVKKVISHPLYDSVNFDYDFSLLQLSILINLKIGVQEVIQLPEEADQIETGTRALVSGWGETKNALESRELLRGVVVQTISFNVCKKIYGSTITQQMVCAGDLIAGGIDSCQLSCK